MKRYSFIKLSFMCLILSLFFIPFDTFAVTNLVGNSGTMGYYINGNYGRNVNWSGNFPVELLTSYSGYYKYLYGLESTFTFNDIYSGNYVNNGVYTYIQVHRGGSQGVMDWNQTIPIHYNAISNTGIEKNGTCSVSSANNQYITYQCQVDYTNNAYPTRVTMIIGQTANFTYNSTPYLGRTMLTDDTSSLYLQAMYFNAYSSNNEEPGGGGSSSTDMTETNEKLDSVNDNLEETNNKLESIGESLTDDDVTSSSNHFDDEFGSGSWGPPPQNNSPLATIVNLPLQYLRTITNNTTCSNLNLTIPYLNTNISIPCITSYLSTNFSSGVVSLVQLIVNALVLYKVGVSFWEFLHNLRDPHSDDLEVVDL